MLEGLIPLKTMFNPKLEPASKPSNVSVKTLEAWDYILSLIKRYYNTEVPLGEPNPITALDHIEKALNAIIEKAMNELQKKCGSEADSISKKISEIKRKTDKRLRELRGKLSKTAANAKEGEEGFASFIKEAKRAGETLAELLQSVSQEIYKVIVECRKGKSRRGCCDACKILAANLQQLAVDSRPLLDTCYDKNKARELYRKLRALIDDARRIGGSLDSKLVAVIVSVITLELAGMLGEELRWLLSLILESIGFEKWLWTGDLVALFYTAQIVAGIPAEAKVSREDAGKILTILARL